MSTATVELPDSLKARIEALAAKEGFTVSQFLASAAGEKLAAILTMDYLRREAGAGRREDFDRYLAAVPDVVPPESDRLVKNATVRKRKMSSEVVTKRSSQGITKSSTNRSSQRIAKKVHRKNRSHSSHKHDQSRADSSSSRQ